MWFNLYQCVCLCVFPSVHMPSALSPRGIAAIRVEQCNDSCLLALHHLYAHQCLPTRHSCLPFLNGFAQRQYSGSLTTASGGESKRGEKGCCGGEGWIKLNKHEIFEDERDEKRWMEVPERSWWGHWRTCYDLISPECSGFESRGHGTVWNAQKIYLRELRGMTEFMEKYKLNPFCMAAGCCCWSYKHLLWSEYSLQSESDAPHASLLRDAQFRFQK